MNPTLDRIVAAIGLVGGTAGLGAAWLLGDPALVWPSVVTLLITVLLLAWSRHAREPSLPRWGTRRRRIAWYTATVAGCSALAGWLAYGYEWRFDAACMPLMLFLVLWLGFVAFGCAERLLREVRDDADAWR